jgi:hypothetical protein
VSRRAARVAALAGLAAGAGCGGREAAPPAGGGDVRPRTVAGRGVGYPRLVDWPDAPAAAGANAVLARRERAEREEARECLAQLRAAGRAADDASYWQDVRVAYQSPRLVSVAVRVSHYCGGPYPTNGEARPVTIDLAAGDTVVWRGQWLAPAALPDDAPAFGATPLGRAYLARWRRLPAADTACAEPLAGATAAPHLWLADSAGQRRLVVEPSLPHVAAACAEAIPLTAADLGTMATPALRAELAPVGPAGQRHATR